ncbi:MAG: hypothetical protein ACRDRV_02245 [Pseudonocardiaceae bacterium]
MSDALSFAEIDGQRVELLPARTVLTGGGGPDFDGDATAGAGTGGTGGISGVSILDILNNNNILSPDASAGSGGAGVGGSAVGNLLGGK